MWYVVVQFQHTSNHTTLEIHGITHKKQVRIPLLYEIYQSAKLKRIAELCNCVVLATNQAVAMNHSMLEDGSGVFGEMNAMSDLTGTKMMPALGQEKTYDSTYKDRIHTYIYTYIHTYIHTRSCLASLCVFTIDHVKYTQICGVEQQQ